VCKWVNEVVKTEVEVAFYEKKEAKKVVPVTTYKCVAEQITEQVPVSPCGYGYDSGYGGHRGGRLLGGHGHGGY